MSGKKIGRQHHATFDGIRHQDADGNEYWRARQLAKVLEYSEYRHFLPVVVRAKAACRNSGQAVADHFEDILEMVEIGSGAQRPVDDVRLSRYQPTERLIGEEPGQDSNPVGLSSKLDGLSGKSELLSGNPESLSGKPEGLSSKLAGLSSMSGPLSSMPEPLSSKLQAERNALLDQLPGQLAARIGAIGLRHPRNRCASWSWNFADFGTGRLRSWPCCSTANPKPSARTTCARCSLNNVSP